RRDDRGADRRRPHLRHLPRGDGDADGDRLDPAGLAGADGGGWPALRVGRERGGGPPAPPGGLMRRRGSRIVLLLAGVLALAGPGVREAAAQQPTPESIVESQRRLEQIRRERAELREEMGRIRSRVTDLSSELENVQRQVQTSAELLSE